MKVEICVATASENLDERMNDPPSTETSSWVVKHASFAGAMANETDSGQGKVDTREEYVNVEGGVWPGPGRSGTSIDYSPFHETPAEALQHSLGPLPVNRTDTASDLFSGDFLSIDQDQRSSNTDRNVITDNICSSEFSRNDAVRLEQELGQRPDVRVRQPVAEEQNLVSLGVYDEGSMSALQGKYDMDFQREREKETREDALQQFHRWKEDNPKELHRSRYEERLYRLEEDEEMGNSKAGVNLRYGHQWDERSCGEHMR